MGGEVGIPDIANYFRVLKDLDLIGPDKLALANVRKSPFIRMGENARTEAMPDAKERVLKVIRDVLKETPPRR